MTPARTLQLSEALVDEMCRMRSCALTMTDLDRISLQEDADYGEMAEALAYLIDVVTRARLH
jgi:hypothetical protein